MLNALIAIIMLVREIIIIVSLFGVVIIIDKGRALPFQKRPQPVRVTTA